MERDVVREQQTLQTLANNKMNITEELTLLLSKYNITFNASDRNLYQSSLQKQYDKFTIALKSLHQYKIDIGILNAEHINAITAAKEKTLKLKAQQTALDNDVKLLENLRAERRSLFADKDPSTERKRLNEAVELQKTYRKLCRPN